MGQILQFKKLKIEPQKFKHVPLDEENYNCDDCGNEFSMKNLLVDSDGKLICKRCINDAEEVI